LENNERHKKDLFHFTPWGSAPKPVVKDSTGRENTVPA
jgi:hypothetical protein